MNSVFSAALRSVYARFLVAWILVMAAGLYGLGGAFRYDGLAQRQFGNDPRIDADTSDFINHVAAHPRFEQTLEWWSGPWFPKVPYYRPLTMTLFWGEYHLFGPQGRPAFQWTHRLLHLGFLSLLLLFLVHVAGWKRGTLGAMLFASTANAWLWLPVGDDAFNCWKDQCDVLSISFITLACLLFLRGARGSNDANARAGWWRARWWWGALGCMVVGLTIKESGYLLPLYLCLTLWLAHRERLWRAVTPFFGVALLGWTYRWWALGGWGHKTGSGGGWPVRFASQVMGLPTSLIAGDGLLLVAGALVALVGLAVWWRLERERGRSGGRAARCMALAVGVAAVGCWRTLTFLPEDDQMSNFARLTMNSVWSDALFLAIMVGGFILSFRLARRGARAMLWSWGWVVVGFLPLILQPPTSPHVHYPIAPGWSLWIACYAAWAFNAALEIAKPLFSGAMPNRPQREMSSVAGE